MYYSDVVNCFQIVSLIYWSQPRAESNTLYVCCELLSDCIFDILVTALCLIQAMKWLLWIAFRLYLWYIGHSIIKNNVKWKSVVNCFQIVSLIYWSQHRLLKVFSQSSCELLSDCIFDILVTAKYYQELKLTGLWIAFRLYLWYIGHSYIIVKNQH